MMAEVYFETHRAGDDIKQRCSIDGQIFDTWEEAWQHMVDEHGWDRESWERRQEIVALVDSVTQHAPRVLGSLGFTVLAQPYTARQCPECKLWIYTDDGPFSEDDPTKTEADYLHWRDEHMDIGELGAPVIGFPFFRYNDEVVHATKEHREP